MRSYQNILESHVFVTSNMERLGRGCQMRIYRYIYGHMMVVILMDKAEFLYSKKNPSLSFYLLTFMPGHFEGHFSVASLKLGFHFSSWTIAGNAATILQNPVPFDSTLCFWQRKRRLKIRRGYIYAVLADMDIEPASIHPRKIGAEGRRLAALAMQEDTALGDPALEPGLREANGHRSPPLLMFPSKVIRNVDCP